MRKTPYFAANFVKYWLIRLLFVFGLLLTIICAFCLYRKENNPSLLVSITALTLSALTFAITHLATPILTIEECQPAFSKSGNDKGTWFHRLKVVNLGLAPAKNCTGRLLEVQDSEGQTISKFDPVILYWPRQGPEFQSITIFRNHDFDYLDVFREGIEADLEKDGLRIHTPKNRELIKGDTDVEGGSRNSLKPGTYHLKIGIFADNGSSSINWYTLTVVQKVTATDKSILSRRK